MMEFEFDYIMKGFEELRQSDGELGGVCMECYGDEILKDKGWFGSFELFWVIGSRNKRYNEFSFEGVEVGSNDQFVNISEQERVVFRCAKVGVKERCSFVQIDQGFLVFFLFLWKLLGVMCVFYFQCFLVYRDDVG